MPASVDRGAVGHCISSSDRPALMQEVQCPNPAALKACALVARAHDAVERHQICYLPTPKICQNFCCRPPAAHQGSKSDVTGHNIRSLTKTASLQQLSSGVPQASLLQMARLLCGSCKLCATRLGGCARDSVVRHHTKAQKSAKPQKQVAGRFPKPFPADRPDT